MEKTETENQLNIYVISDNEYIEKGPGWKGFWRKDYNISDNDKEGFYSPEKETGLIDERGIDAIKKIDCDSQNQLEGKQRSILAFYVALQYIRTPRFREEKDKFMEAGIKNIIKNELSIHNTLNISKEKLLEYQPKNQQEKEFLKITKLLTEEEINKQVLNFFQNDDYNIILTNSGHSKAIFKVDELAKELFKFQWFFLIAPKDSSFATSDNPCFTTSPTKLRQDLLSPKVTIYFPLRPNLCITIKPKFKSNQEIFFNIDKKEVRKINKLILKNSYQCLITKDKEHLEHLTKNFCYKNHRRLRDTIVYGNGVYKMFNIE